MLRSGKLSQKIGHSVKVLCEAQVDGGHRPSHFRHLRYLCQAVLCCLNAFIVLAKHASVNRLPDVGA